MEVKVSPADAAKIQKNGLKLVVSLSKSLFLELDARFDAFAFQLLYVSVDTEFVDGPHRVRGNTQGNEFAGFRHEEFLLLNVGYETTLRLPVGVGNVVAADWLLTREFTNFRHRKIR